MARKCFASAYLQSQYRRWANQTGRLFQGSISPDQYVQIVSNMAPYPETVRSAKCVAAQAPKAAARP